MIIYHVTLAEHLPSIMQTGVDTAYSQGAQPVVWGVQRGMIPWAVIHSLRRHGGRAEDLMVLEIVADDDTMRRFKGGLWYSTESWLPARIVRVQTFEQYVASTSSAGAKL